MLKPLTMSLGLAIALGVCSASMAGIGNCSTCGLASPQGVVASPQASPQSCGTTGGGLCGGGGGWKMPKLCHKPKCYTYEWVLKKKRVWGCGGGGCATGYETCGAVYPSSQGYASPQGYSSGQSYIPTTYGSGQSYGGGYGSGQSTYGTGQMYGGSGQAYGAPAASSMTPAPAAGGAAPAPAGEEAPPAPEVPSTPSTPSPAPPAPPTGPTSSLLFSTPSGN